MGDSYRWSNGGSIAHGPAISDDRRRYHSSRDMVVAANPAAITADTARRYHSTRDIQVRPTSMQDLRCYSASYAAYGLPPLELGPAAAAAAAAKGKDPKAGYVPSSSFRAGGSFRWVDPELQRRKRVAAYKAYGVEGKMKGSVKKGWRWVRERYKDLLQGLW